ncbi:hypothetical protein D9758_007187 [Tetrapyrgos nigripes]|uniref:PIG-P domain-containing protein n=1 Tax=Tetrapyrgos nigripes TaxID=182062 RepID=A0A8H5D0U5_9AGAR|nr:hypothetical protein D9758_007187 [Tetrapyrgos nigripes]
MTKDVSPTSPTTPLAPFPIQYKSRAPEFYGFVAWTSTSFLFVIYVLWALLPDEWIVWLGVEWYPNREWSILVPAWTIVVILLTYFIYFALALFGTPAFNQPRAISDSRSHFPKMPQSSSSEDTDINEPSLSSLYQAYAPFARPDAIPELYDIPIGMVNRVLYGKEKD